MIGVLRRKNRIRALLAVSNDEQTCKRPNGRARLANGHLVRSEEEKSKHRVINMALVHDVGSETFRRLRWPSNTTFVTRTGDKKDFGDVEEPIFGKIGPIKESGQERFKID